MEQAHPLERGAQKTVAVEVALASQGQEAEVRLGANGGRANSPQGIGP